MPRAKPDHPFPWHSITQWSSGSTRQPFCLDISAPPCPRAARLPFAQRAEFTIPTIPGEPKTRGMADRVGATPSRPLRSFGQEPDFSLHTVDAEPAGFVSDERVVQHAAKGLLRAPGTAPGWGDLQTFSAEMCGAHHWRPDATTSITTVMALADGRLLAECHAIKQEDFEAWLRQKGWTVESITPITHLAKTGSIWQVA